MAASNERKMHSGIPNLVAALEDRRLDRRHFLRMSTLLGLSATSAYGIVGKVLGSGVVPAARAQGTPVEGGVLKISMRVPDLRSPHTFAWGYDSNVVRQVNDYLTRTGVDNVTRPWLAESWQASEDLKTWTFNLRKNVTWNDGERFVAEHVKWNIERVLDPDVGSSVLGLMQGYLMVEKDGSSRIWDANAIEVVDDHTIVLNCKEPQLAVPEHLFHYPLLMLYPKENGEWRPGSVGTGAFVCTDVEVGRRAIVTRRPGGYWGTGPYVDEIHFIDTGEEPAADIAALSSKQVDGQYQGNITQYQVLQQIPHLQLHDAVTAATGVVRMKVGEPPFDDPRVRKAIRLALDQEKLLQIGHIGLGAPGEHHHVCPTQPDYADVGFVGQDIEAAKALLAEAGQEGLTLELTVSNSPDWEQITMQAAVEMWAEAGITVNLNLVPESQYWEIWTQVPFGFTSWAHRPLGIMLLALAYRTGVPWNETGYANPEFDALLLKAEATLDLEERREVMARLEEIMLEDGPVALPLWRGLFSFWDRKVKGFQHHPTFYIFGEEIWIDEAA